MARCPQAFEFGWADVVAALLGKANSQIDPTKRADEASQKARNYLFHEVNVDPVKA